MIQDSRFKNTKIGVIGAGVEGISSAKWLIKQGAEVTVLDKKGAEVQGCKGARLITGENYLANLSAYDIVVRSPGVKRNLPEILDAEKNGKLITSHTQIFFDLCPAPIIGITGTKGKGTTSALIYEMLKVEGPDAYLGGNIGNPPLEFLDKLTPSSWVVLELSSFQLEDLNKSPHIAVVLMIVPEHLGIDSVGTANYHDSMEDYVSTKRNILRFQKETDYAIVNRDYPPSHESDIYTESRVFQVSREREASEDGCFTRQGRIIIRKTGKEETVLEISDVLLPGKHNLENVCAAVMAADLAGVSIKSIANVLRRFKGLEHRLELVREVRGVRYYDDSFSTTPETAIAAIEAFTDPEILILGGSHKGSDFTELGRVISERQNIKAIIGIGAEWINIKSKIKNQKSKIIEGCQSMEEVVQRASETAELGDVVLLSPACASFGMFKNYKERGELFKSAVNSL